MYDGMICLMKFAVMMFDFNRKVMRPVCPATQKAEGNVIGAYLLGASRSVAGVKASSCRILKATDLHLYIDVIRCLINLDIALLTIYIYIPIFVYK